MRVAEKDPKVVGITAAMPSGTGLDYFGEKFPDRCFDVGIAEQHAVTFAAGLAAEGMKPFAAIYSTFLQRGYDSVVHDVAIQKLPVRFALDRAGLVGADGPTHAGSFDIGYLGQLPGFVLMAAADETELQRMVATAHVIDDRPSAFRYPRGEGVGLPLLGDPQPLEIGKGRIVKQGSTMAILSYGTRLQEAMRAADMLAAQGLSTTVADARFAKPLDEALIAQLARHHEVLITIEEGATGRLRRLRAALAGRATACSIAGLKVRTLHAAGHLPGSGHAREDVRAGRARCPLHRRHRHQGAGPRRRTRAQADCGLNLPRLASLRVECSMCREAERRP